MKIWTRLRPEHIFLNVSIPDKDAALRFVADVFVRDGIVKDASALWQGMQLREQTMSTGIGNGIGIPHTTSTEAKDAALLLVVLKEPIDFEALDNSPVDTILALVLPENQTTLHLRMLAAISRLCQNPGFLEFVRRATDSKTLLEEIRRLEEGIAFH